MNESYKCGRNSRTLAVIQCGTWRQMHTVLQMQMPRDFKNLKMEQVLGSHCCWQHVAVAIEKRKKKCCDCRVMPLASTSKWPKLISQITLQHLHTLFRYRQSFFDLRVLRRWKLAEMSLHIFRQEYLIVNATSKKLPSSKTSMKAAS